MEDKAALTDVGMYITSGCLIVPIQIELNDETALHLQSEILKRIEKTDAKGVVMDFSGVDVMDSFLCNIVFDTARMAGLLGARAVVTGLQPGVVVSIVNLNIDFKDVLISSTLEEGIQRVMPKGPECDDGAYDTEDALCPEGGSGDEDGLEGDDD